MKIRLPILVALVLTVPGCPTVLPMVSIDYNVPYDEFIETKIEHPVRNQEEMLALADQLEQQANLLEVELAQKNLLDDAAVWLLNRVRNLISVIRASGVFPSTERTADVYYTKPGPPIVLIHGGGWTVGDKSDFRSHARLLAAEGYVVFAINYRLAPLDPWPAMIDDCRLALSWVLSPEVAQRYQLELENGVAISGHSAGGHLTALLATEIHEGVAREQIACAILLAAPLDMVSTIGFNNQNHGIASILERVTIIRDLMLQIVLGIAPPQETTLELTLEQLETISPLYHAKTNQEGTKYPNFLIIQGGMDLLLSSRQAIEFESALNDANATSFLELLETGHHLGIFDGEPLEKAESWQIVTGFLDEYFPVVP